MFQVVVREAETSPLIPQEVVRVVGVEVLVDQVVGRTTPPVASVPQRVLRADATGAFTAQDVALLATMPVVELTVQVVLRVTGSDASTIQLVDRVGVTLARTPQVVARLVLREDSADHVVARVTEADVRTDQEVARDERIPAKVAQVVPRDVPTVMIDEATFQVVAREADT